MFEKDKKSVLDTALMLRKYELVALSGGNVTVRMPTGEFLITPSGIIYERMNINDIVVLDAEGEKIEGSRKPSVDTKSILYIFNNIPWINAVIHTHQPYATAIGLVDNEFPACLTTLVDATGGPVKVAPYLPSNDKDMGKLVVEYAFNSLAVILKHHGVVTFGKDLDEALFAAVYLEEAAKSYIAVRPIKTFESFDNNEIEHARIEAEHYGQKP